MRNVGVIGLGSMGLALVRALVSEGFPTHCYDLRKEATAAGTSLGAVVAESPRDCAQSSDVVLAFLPGPGEVVDVALDPESGVLAGLAPGAAMLDMSTCGPDVAEVVGQAFDAAGRRFVDCPVSRKPPNSTVLVGGRVGVLGDDEQVLASVSRTVVHCGHRGAGYATKLLNQHVKYSCYLASAEALMLAEALELDVSEVSSTLEQCSGGESALSHAAEFFRDDNESVRIHAPARTIEKDLMLAEAMATRAGVRARSLAVAVDFFVEVGLTDLGDRPYPLSCELLRASRTMPPQRDVTLDAPEEDGEAPKTPRQ